MDIREGKRFSEQEMLEVWGFSGSRLNPEGVGVQRLPFCSFYVWQHEREGCSGWRLDVPQDCGGRREAFKVWAGHGQLFLAFHCLPGLPHDDL